MCREQKGVSLQLSLQIPVQVSAITSISLTGIILRYREAQLLQFGY